MTDPTALANLAITVLSKTTEALTGLRERAQRSKDADIKDQINTLFDNVLQLKDVVSRLLDANNELKRQLEQQQLARVQVPKIRQVGETNYYFQGEEGPYCQPCYDKEQRLVMLEPQRTTEWGSIKRLCPVCRRTFYEKEVKANPSPTRFGPWS